MSTIEDVANLDVPLPSCQAEKNEKRKTNYKQVLSIQSDFKNRDLPDNQDEYACYVVYMFIIPIINLLIMVIAATIRDYMIKD